MENGSGAEGKWQYGLVAVILLVWIGGVCMSRSVVRPVAVAPVGVAAGVAGDWPVAQQVLEYADHGRLEVFGAGLGEYVVERVPVVQPQAGMLERLRDKFGHVRVSVGSSGHSVESSSSSDGRYQIETRSDFQNGVMKSCRTAAGELQPLMLELRMFDSAGVVARHGRCLSSGTVMEVSEYSHEEIGALGPLGTQAAEHRAALGAAQLGLLVQHRDPVSGWVNLDGPYRTKAELDGRGLYLLFGWQRDQLELDFRAIRADGEVVAFKIANPDYQKEPAAQPAALELPARLEWEGFALELSALRRVARPDGQPFTRCGLELRPGQLGIDPDDLLRVETRYVSDEWGNRVPLGLAKGPDGWEEGFALPGGSRRANVHAVIGKSPWYPRAEGECVMLAEGVVSADGKRVDFTLLPGAAEFGVTAVPVCELDQSDCSLPIETRGQLSIRLESNLTEKALAKVSRTHGGPSGWLPAFFLDGSTQSGGVPRQTGMSVGTSGGNTQAQLSYQWSCLVTALRPGAHIRFGIASRQFPGELVFPVEQPPVQGTRD